MPIFRKRPLAVQADQWFPGREVAGVAAEPRPGGDPPRHYVVTIHGQRAYLEPGDWVIAECDGIHHYPCKQDVFKATYVPA
jgi:hypothetical protein